MMTCKLPSAVYAGEGALAQLGELCRGMRRVAVLSDRGIERSGALARPVKIIESAGSQALLEFDLPSEPTCDQAQALVDRFRRMDAGLIVAVGGGSVMDVAKLCSIAADGSFTVRELIDNPSLGKKCLRSVMIPTTAGTGAEATPNSIVAVPEKELKVGIVNEEMIPDAVILDAEMTRGLPAHVAASTGVDALCHAIECYTSKKATRFSNLFAAEALRLIFSSIERACLSPEDAQARAAMLLGAFYAGVAISCSGTTAVHALSYPLGGRYHIPHGVANAMLLMPVMRFNADACREDLAGAYDALGRGLTGGDAAGEREKAGWVLGRMEEIVHNLHIPTDLRAYGVRPEDLDSLVSAGMNVTRLLVNNKREMTPEAARAIYAELLL